MTQRRYLVLWFPLLPTDRLAREGGAVPDSAPVAMTERRHGAIRLTACNAAAQALGLVPGLTLADARAQVPELVLSEADPGADARWLDRIAASCDRFTPRVAIEPPDALVLDITGCAHLFGGEAALVAQVAQSMQGWTRHLAHALTDTPEGARALAKFCTQPADSEAAALRQLPVEALELDAETEVALRRAGFRTLGELADRPARTLAARFGAAMVDRLAGVLGGADRRITPRSIPDALVFERRLLEPILRAEDAMAVIGQLAADASRALRARGEGGRRFLARLFRTDGHVAELDIESGLPLADPARIMRLFSERMAALADPLDPGFGFDAIRLAVPHAEPFDATQLQLDGRADSQEAIAALVDRLSARHGRRRIRRFTRRDTHVPERAEEALPALDVTAAASWPAPQAGEPPRRPLHLFDPPQPVEVVAEPPDGPPRSFRWRRTLHEVARCEGPERIAAEWWRGPPGRRPATRDYYRVENPGGGRFWLFRRASCAAEGGEPGWYIHGIFP